MIDDMYDSIGATVKTGNKDGENRYGGDWVASTTINHAVSSRFSGGSTTATVLEIYAPKDYTRGAYINDFSYFNGESEILLDGGTEFKVVDDGTRVVLITDFDGYDETALERYMKLQITGVKGKDSKDFGTPVVVSSSTGEAPEIPYYNIIVDCEDIKITDALRRSGFDTSTKIKNRLYSALSEELGGKFDIDNSVI